MYPIMDESGKAATWLKENGCLYLWESQLIGEPVVNMLTAKDERSEGRRHMHLVALGADADDVRAAHKKTS